MFYKLKDINFTTTGLLLVNYLGCPELGTHETDLRNQGILDEDYDSVPDNNQSYNPMKSFNSIKEPRVITPNKRLNW